MGTVKTAFVRTRIEPDLKEHVHAIFYKMGVTPTQVITMFYKYVEYKRKLPFSPFVPNEATVKAIKEARNGEGVVVCKNADDMFKKLGISDADTDLQK